MQALFQLWQKNSNFESELVQLTIQYNVLVNNMNVIDKENTKEL